MNAAVALLGGFVCGFGSSAPVGPINLWVASSALSERRARIPPFLTGVVLVDVVWAGLAIAGATQWLEAGHPLGRGLALVGGVLLLCLGCALWRGRNSAAAPTAPMARGRAAAALAQGMALCASAPALPAFWILAVASITQLAGPLDGGAAVAGFLFGIVIGDVLWFSIVVRLMGWLARRAGGESTFQSGLFVRIHKGTAVILIALGVGALVSGFA